MTKRRLSSTYIQTMLECPLKCRLTHTKGIVKYTTYPLLLGIAVHSYINFMHSGNHPERTFYYKELNTALRMWFKKWEETLSNPQKPIKFPDKKQADIFGVTGMKCIEHYWKQNINKPQPVYKEKDKTFTFQSGVELNGRIDQIRVMDLERIKKFNPSIIRNGTLDSNYLPYVIVDLKTGRHHYDIRERKPDASMYELATSQFELHEYVQPTVYYWIFQKWFGKLPAGFFWYHLQSGTYNYTSRTELDFKQLRTQIDYVLDLQDADEVPMHVSDRCKYCEVLDACLSIRGKDKLQYSVPASEIDDTILQPVGYSDTAKPSDYTQLKFRLGLKKFRESNNNDLQ